MINIVKRFFLIVLLALIAFSCEKDESIDLLTGGKWILDTGIISTTRETIVFNTDNTYLIDSELYLPRKIFPVKAQMSGNFILDNNSIHFTSTFLDLPEDTTSIPLYPFEEGQSMGNFYSYLSRWICQNDSSLIDSTYNIRFSNLITNSQLVNGANEKRTWIIQKLNADSLVISVNGTISRYCRE